MASVTTFAPVLNKKIPYKTLFTILLLTAFMAQCFSKTFIIADYYSRTAAYEKNCENIAKPQLKCKGKCQMMKQLQEEEEKNSQSPGGKSELKAETLLSSKSFFTTNGLPALNLSQPKPTTVYSEGLCLHRSFAIFHPPRV